MGPPGTKGDKGEQGPKGDKGYKGEIGQTGPEGPAGEKGQQGAVGAEGAMGLKGKEGIRGPPGPNGPDGAVGLPGRDGPNGEKGEKGELGPAGPEGRQGEPGPPGPPATIENLQQLVDMGLLEATRQMMRDEAERRRRAAGDENELPPEYTDGLEEIFGSLEALKIEIEQLKRPIGTRFNPARTCKDLQMCHEDFPDGMYWIDPNQGCSKDAIEVFCNFTAGGETCVLPDQEYSQEPARAYRKATYGDWFSEFKQGYTISYSNVGVVQMTFLRLLSASARQNFTYTCSHTSAWFDTDSDTHDKSVILMGANEEEFAYGTKYEPNVIKDGCKNKPAKGKTVFEIETTKLHQLPIIDFLPGEFGGDQNSRFGFEVGPICFN